MFANPVGEANDARKKTAMLAAAYTGSAKMELVFVSVGGMDAIAPLRDVLKAVQTMEAARPILKENHSYRQYNVSCRD